MAEGSWNDAASLYATATGTPIQDTYQTAMGSSRIDIFKHCCVVEVPPEGIKRHKPVEGRWSCDLSREFATQIRPIRGLPKRQTNIDPDENDSIIEETIIKEVDTFYNAYLDDDVDTMWDCWCKMAESYLLTKAAVESGQLNIIGDARYYGRGKIQEKRKRVTRGPDPSSGIQPQEERRELQKLANILREIKSLLTLSREPEAKPIWKKACRLGAVCAKHHYWNQRHTPSLEAIDTLVLRVKKFYTKLPGETVYAKSAIGAENV